MIIKTDKEAKTGVEWLCNIAFRAGGIKALEQCNKILNCIEMIKPEKKKPKKK